MYQALYRKYRPTNIKDVIGQKVIVKTLTNEIKNNKVSHAYLFAGPRGTGKTSIAKIIAKTINCFNLNDILPCEQCVSCTQINLGQTIDVIEIDAASNNGVDEIRELKSKVNLVPSVSKYKVYIIDEVHMLTTGAFNALLKTLEEPPVHVIFILATTDPQKVPSTIISRCQRFDFKKITTTEIVEALKKISNNEKLIINNDVLDEIARLSDGGLRDSINLLDQVIAYSNGVISINDVLEVSGTISFIEIKEFIKDILNNDVKNLFEKIDKFNMDGKNFNKLNEEIIYFLRNLILYKNAPIYFKEHEDVELYDSLIATVHLENIINMIQIFSDNTNNLKQNSNPKLIFELSIIKTIGPNVLNNKVKTNESIEDVSYKMNPVISNEVKLNEKKQENEKEKDKINEDIDFEELKKIRINNALAGFKKEELKEIIKKSDSLRSVLVVKKYSEIAKTLLDSEIKVYGNKQIIYLCEEEPMSEYINNNLSIAEQSFSRATGIDLKIIAVNSTEWKQIKEEYNSKSKEYKYIDDKIDIQKFAKIKSNIEDEMTTIFGNVIEYK